MTQGGRTINTSAKMSPLARLAGVALDTLLPPQCPACGDVVESAGTLCGPCWRKVDFLGDPQCSACGLPFEFDPGPLNGPGDNPGNAPGGAILCGACIRARPPYARARSVMVYGDFSRRIVLAFKHADRTDTAPALGRWLVRAGAELIRDADLIAPVPLHWTRLFSRRYNQAALLAGVVGGLSRVAVVPAGLYRLGPLRNGRRGSLWSHSEAAVH